MTENPHKIQSSDVSRRTASAFLALGALAFGVAVGLDAMTAHGPGVSRDPQAAGWIATATRYQMLHGLALLVLAVLTRVGLAGWLPRLAAFGFVAGIALFCGGLYLAGIGDIQTLRPLVPVGGTAFLLGWLALFAAALRWR